MNPATERAFDALSRISGVSKAEIHQIARDAIENNRRLEECRGHTFVAVDGTDHPRQKFRCVHCQGVIDAHAHRWYQRGHRDGRTT